MKKIKEGDVVVITQTLKNKIGEEIQPIGTVVGIYGDDVSVILENSDIWTGSLKFVFKQEKENE